MTISVFMAIPLMQPCRRKDGHRCARPSYVPSDPNGVTHTSPGQRPGLAIQSRRALKGRDIGAPWIGEASMSRPFRADEKNGAIPGRCPGLVYHAPSGLCFWEDYPGCRTIPVPPSRQFGAVRQDFHYSFRRSATGQVCAATPVARMERSGIRVRPCRHKRNQWLAAATWISLRSIQATA